MRDVAPANDPRRDNRARLERARSAASSVRGPTPAEKLAESALARILDLVPLSPEQIEGILQSTKNLAAAAEKARRAGVPGAVLWYEGLLASLPEAYARTVRGPGSLETNLHVLNGINRELERARPEYQLHVGYQRRLDRGRKDLSRTNDALQASLAELQLRRKGEAALQKVNGYAHARRIAEEDAKRPEIETRLGAGKTYEQIARAVGWNKTKLTMALKRWGLSRRPSKKRSGLDPVRWTV